MKRKFLWLPRKLYSTRRRRMVWKWLTTVWIDERLTA